MVCMAHNDPARVAVCSCVCGLLLLAFGCSPDTAAAPDTSATDAVADGGAIETSDAGSGPCQSADDCTNAHCRGVGTSAATCVVCLLDSHCEGADVCLAGACVPTTACESDKSCQKVGGACDTKNTKRCVECVADGDCDAGTCADGRCSASRVPCVSSKACAELGGVCDGKEGFCGDRDAGGLSRGDVVYRGRVCRQRDVYGRHHQVLRRQVADVRCGWQLGGVEL